MTNDEEHLLILQRTIVIFTVITSGSSQRPLSLCSIVMGRSHGQGNFYKMNPLTKNLFRGLVYYADGEADHPHREQVGSCCAGDVAEGFIP